MMSYANEWTRRQGKSAPHRNIPATAGDRLGLTLVEVFVVILIIGLLIALLAPSTRSSREAARRSQCKNNLKQIGLSLHQYHDEYGCFPPTEVIGHNLQPLHSWRTLIVPFFDAGELTAKIELSKPWNEPVNAEALKICPQIFRCPNSNDTLEKANYAAVLGDNTILCRERGRSISEVTDGTSNTLVVVELPNGDAVPWMSPQEADIERLLSLSGQNKWSHTGGWHALLGDGAVRFISEQTSASVLRALTTASAGDEPGEF